MVDFYAWLVAGLIFLILEMGHPGLFFWLSFSIGSFIAAALTWYACTWYVVMVGFLAGSLVAIASLKYFIRSVAHQDPEAHTLTNTDALIGKIGIVTVAITGDQPGRVRIGGEVWSARAGHVGSINVGAHVTVVAVSGSHVIVKAATK
jgi:membrane protein implicated in regulation of membrane protease activity